MADELGPFANALPPALDAAGPFLTETRLLVKQAPANLRAFSPIIQSARRATPDLSALIEKVLPLGNALRAYIPDDRRASSRTSARRSAPTTPTAT